jgi:hypothetical protein
MKQAVLNTLYNILDLLNLWWSGAYDYYEERSVKLSISFYAAKINIQKENISEQCVQ